MGSKDNILDTLSYFNFFNYPLTKEEIWQFSKINIKKEKFFDFLGKMNIPSYKSFYYLSNRKQIVNQRLDKERINDRKIKKALPIIKKLSFIPTVEFIGISGSLAMKNAREDEDIDIFVICKNNLTWLTRLLMVLLLSFLGVYRKKNDLNIKDKICLNLIIGKSKIGFTKKRQNLYIAHEIVQLMPIFSKENCYFDFLNKNKWIINFFPNYRERINGYKIHFNKTQSFKLRFLVNIFFFLKIEKLAKFLQLSYMKKDITKEIIADNFLAFHPQNVQEKVAAFLKQNL